MKKIGILGDIGSGKSFVAKQFGCPIFNADNEVNKIYKKSKLCFKKLRKKLPKYIKSYPINKAEISKAILANNKNLFIISKIVHPLIRKKMNLFLKKNNNKKIVILDIPLLIENKLNKKKDILIYVDAKNKDIQTRLTKRKRYNKKLIKKLKKMQYSIFKKKRISNYIIKNNFKPMIIKKKVEIIKNKVLK